MMMVRLSKNCHTFLRVNDLQSEFRAKGHFVRYNIMYIAHRILYWWGIGPKTFGILVWNIDFGCRPSKGHGIVSGGGERLT